MRHQRFRDEILSLEALAPDPLAQLRKWIEDAAADEPDPYAMTLATVGLDGAPSSRTVALKEIRDGGLLFTTPLSGPKARELEADPRASIVFYWPSVSRQVRAMGIVRQLPREVAEAIFDGRPRECRLAQHVAEQSKPIKTRVEMEARLAELDAEFADARVPMPAWGAFELRPSIVEFWQGHTNRLHDRFRYHANNGGQWRIDRLMP